MNSNKIHLVNCNEHILRLILGGDDYLAKSLDIIVPPQWSENGKHIFEFTLHKIKENPRDEKWYAYLPIETQTKTLLGSCGYKGPPDENGNVEIGYEVAKDFWNKGYATDIAKCLITKAFADERVKNILAHTPPDNNASVSVLKKCNFKFVEEYEDVEDGKIWKWIREK